MTYFNNLDGLMRRLLFVVICFFLVQHASFASSNITLIYLHGSNLNTHTDRQRFEKRIHKLHPALKKEIEKKVKGENINPGISDYVINAQPRVFFWGSHEVALESLRSRLDMTKSISAPAAFWVRRFLSYELHDAVWVVKSRHFLPILEELNQQITEEYNKGNKVIISGYSMGAFVTYKYLLFKLRYLSMEQVFEAFKINDKEIADFIEDHPRENTCLSAITDGNIGNISLEGKFSLNKNKDELKQNYLNLEQLSNKHCAPKGSVLGVINYGSPLAIFHSELEDEDDEFVIYTSHLSDNILSNGLFFITVNFLEDPLGFPLMTSDTELLKYSGDNLNPSSKGLIYDNYSVRSWRWFLTAHDSYFGARKIFSKEIAKSFNAER